MQNRDSVGCGDISIGFLGHLRVEDQRLWIGEKSDDVEASKGMVEGADQVGEGTDRLVIDLIDDVVDEILLIGIGGMREAAGEDDELGAMGVESVDFGELGDIIERMGIG
jgi:hypothetical protein